jgi:hypothetical protein
MAASASAASATGDNRVVMARHETLLPLPSIESTGSVLRREALEHGLTQREIERLLERGVRVRVGYGAYAPADRWQQMSPE